MAISPSEFRLLKVTANPIGLNVATKLKGGAIGTGHRHLGHDRRNSLCFRKQCGYEKKLIIIFDLNLLTRF
jgi:hypothetical protein